MPSRHSLFTYNSSDREVGQGVLQEYTPTGERMLHEEDTASVDRSDGNSVGAVARCPGTGVAVRATAAADPGPNTTAGTYADPSASYP
jgi:hypothetical protein